MTARAVRSALTPSGRAVAIRYLLIAVGANLAWEMAQLPFYTIWRSAGADALAFAVLHCTAGDAAILATTLLAALLLAGDARWPFRGYGRVALMAVLLGIAFTIFSEWINVEVWGRWGYAEIMLVVPRIGTGLTRSFSGC